jgi:DNA replication protein DnaC
MECDNVIDKKLLQFPMVRDVWSKTSFNVFVGKMDSGKTSLMTQLTKKVFKQCFHRIYVLMPENSRQSIENDIFGKYNYSTS